MTNLHVATSKSLEACHTNCRLGTIMAFDIKKKPRGTQKMHTLCAIAAKANSLGWMRGKNVPK